MDDAEEIARRVSTYFEEAILSPSDHKSRKLVYLHSVGTFLSYIKNATYMITDSFHGIGICH